MKIIKELTLILLIYFVGEIINKYVIPLLKSLFPTIKDFIPNMPGTVIGMILLLLLLLSGVIKINQIEKSSNYLLGNLSFFFIPSAVGLITVLDVVQDNVIPIFVIMIVSSIVVVITTGLTVQFLKKVLKK